MTKKNKSLLYSERDNTEWWPVFVRMWRADPHYGIGGSGKYYTQNWYNILF